MTTNVQDDKDAMLKLEHVSKYFVSTKGIFRTKKNVVKAVDDISLSVDTGEILGLVGESGSGKTTLARVLLGLTKPSGGEIYINGISLAHASKREIKQIRRDVAVVFQDPASNLNPRQTVESSIMRPMILHGVKKAEAGERTGAVMDMVKMDRRYLMSYPYQLSGGQLQRIAIARALALQPKVMILDEPTSALDVSVQAQILNLLLDLQQELHLTYLVITHDISVIRYISDRVAVMNHGKLVECGETETVLDQPQHSYTKRLMNSVPIMDPFLRGGKRPDLEDDGQ